MMPPGAPPFPPGGMPPPGAFGEYMVLEEREEVANHRRRPTFPAKWYPSRWSSSLPSERFWPARPPSG